MIRKNKIILSSVLFILFYFFVLIPYLYRREAARTVQSVIKSWQTGDMSYAFNAWLDMQKSPPVYELVSAKITKSIFDKKDGARHALIYAILTFKPDNTLPSDKEWVFELNRTALGWKVINFYLAEP